MSVSHRPRRLRSCSWADFTTILHFQEKYRGNPGQTPRFSLSVENSEKLVEHTGEDAGVLVGEDGPLRPDDVAEAGGVVVIEGGGAEAAAVSRPVGLARLRDTRPGQTRARSRQVEFRLWLEAGGKGGSGEGGWRRIRCAR